MIIGTSSGHPETWDSLSADDGSVIAFQVRLTCSSGDTVLQEEMKRRVKRWLQFQVQGTVSARQPRTPNPVPHIQRHGSRFKSNRKINARASCSAATYTGRDSLMSACDPGPDASFLHLLQCSSVEAKPLAIISRQLQRVSRLDDDICAISLFLGHPAVPSSGYQTSPEVVESA